MKKALILILMLCLLLSACGGEELIGEAAAVDIALQEAAEITGKTFAKDSAIVRLVPESCGYCYKVGFDGIVILVSAVTGEVVSTSRAL